MKSIYDIFLKVILKNIIPHTEKAIKDGNKVFGAAILNKNDYSLVCIGINNEIKNPLFHGEISALNNFFKIPSKQRPDTKDCFFLSTHEPCSLCLSAITWSGFDNFYYLFKYNDTKNKFNIPYDLNILKEVFKIKKGKYNRKNIYWKSFSIMDYSKKLVEPEKSIFIKKINKVTRVYNKLSSQYQKKKKKIFIPLK